MQQAVRLLLAEASDLRAALLATRSLLYRIDLLALSVASGLAVGIYVYKVDEFKLFGPFLMYLVGFLWSTESFRLLKLRDHIRRLEIEAREMLEGSQLPAGFETRTRGKAGLLFPLRNESISLPTALLVGTLFAFSLYLLTTSNASAGVRYGMLAFYLVFGAVFWIYDVWGNFELLLGATPRRWLEQLTRRNTTTASGDSEP